MLLQRLNWIKRGALLLFVTLFLSCGSSDSPPSAGDTNLDAAIVARYGEIDITVEDIDARILSLPASERPLPGEDLDAWYREQARALLLERLLLNEAKSSGLANDPAFQKARANVERSLILRHYLRNNQPELQKVDESDVREAFEERQDQLVKPERRLSYHLFRRASSAEEFQEARTELAELRNRILRGENFQKMAARLSDSETRHREGSLGWIVPGGLDPNLETVIFSLEEGVPSEPVVTGQGVHLFYVDIILPEQKLTYDEARPRLMDLLVQEKVVIGLKTLTEDIEAPADAHIPDREELETIFRTGNRDTELISVGDNAISLQEFRQSLPGAKPGGRRNPREAGLNVWQSYERLRDTMLIVHHARTHQLVTEADIADEMAAWERLALITEQRRRALLDLAKADDSRLKLFYESNIGRFSSPVRIKLDLLRIPIDANADTVMGQLETAASNQDQSLEALAELGGTIESIDWLTIPALQQRFPKLPPLVSTRKAGQLTAPYRAGDFIEIARLVDREEAKPLPFDDIREDIAMAYMGSYQAALYQRLLEQQIDDSQLAFNPAGLQALREEALSEKDVAVEEIEALLEELEPSL